MASELHVERELLEYAEAHRGHLISLIQDLVRIPSENTPPSGAELACQHYCRDYLAARGFEADLYELSDVDGLESHPLYFPGRDYSGRPNLAATLKGGGGPSILLSGHIDTVPRGTLPWSRDPFSGHVENGLLYGRGSNDMKAGIATNLFVAQAFNDLGIQPSGDVTIECVVDEEFGGVNGTLAGRLRGHMADAAIISEPSFLRVCNAQRGGRTAHITFTSANEGILSDHMEDGVAGQVAWFLSQVPGFAQLRRATAPAHPAYRHLANPVPVSVLKIHTGPWGTGEPMATACVCRIELFWQTMPGESLETIDAQFNRWFNETIASRPGLFPSRPEVDFPIRWLPGSALPVNGFCQFFMRRFTEAAADALGRPPEIAGIEGPCDMYVFHQHFGMPAILWGARGANTHLADESVEIASVVDSAKALLLFVYRWGRTPRPR
ncbi:MAG: hypothetical protein C0504_10400 [Candidatus Solibacter sp.]|nr:hypothetical protein [Candidatus Solibacter sp.]